MPAKVTVDIKGIQARFADQRLKNAQTKFAMQVGEDMNTFVHWDTQQLQDSMLTNSDFENGQIIWSAKNDKDQDYAQYAYEEDPSPKERNPKATPHWDKEAKENHLDDWLKAAASLMGGRAK